MNVEYFKPAYVVIAALGIYLVEPLYRTTIVSGATNSSLVIFYKSVYNQMENAFLLNSLAFHSHGLMLLVHTYLVLARKLTELNLWKVLSKQRASIYIDD